MNVRCLLLEQINQFRAPREIINSRINFLDTAAQIKMHLVCFEIKLLYSDQEGHAGHFYGPKISPKQLSWPTHSTRTFTALIWAIKLNWPGIFDLWQSR
jgi:hypothetical protein